MRTKKWEITRERYMSLDEISKLRRSSDDRALADLAKGRTSGVRSWAVIDLALSTGLRVSEISGVTIGDLTLSGPEPQLVVRNGKGGKSRTVTLPQDLKRHLREFISWKRRIAEPVEPKAHLFVSERGTKFTTPALQLLFKRATKKAGLHSHLLIHACRHPYGTYLYQKTNETFYSLISTRP